MKSQHCGSLSISLNRQEAVDAEPGVVASRDTTWDAREAIFFLEEEYRGDIFRRQCRA